MVRNVCGGVFHAGPAQRWGRRGRFRTPSAFAPTLRADGEPLCPRAEEIGEREGGQGAHRILAQPLMPHFRETPQDLHDVKRMLAAGTNAGALAVERIAFRRAVAALNHQILPAAASYAERSASFQYALSPCKVSSGPCTKAGSWLMSDRARSIVVSVCT